MGYFNDWLGGSRQRTTAPKYTRKAKPGKMVRPRTPGQGKGVPGQNRYVVKAKSPVVKANGVSKRRFGRKLGGKIRPARVKTLGLTNTKRFAGQLSFGARPAGTRAYNTWLGSSSYGAGTRNKMTGTGKRRVRRF